jgi:hypothetical protein
MPSEQLPEVKAIIAARANLEPISLVNPVPFSVPGADESPPECGVVYYRFAIPVK